MKTMRKIEGCLNFRDLGGMPCANGGITRSNKFYRCDCLSRMTVDDIDYLKAMGIRCIIDLRTLRELERRPNPASFDRYFCYYHISLLNGIKSKDYVNQSPESLPVMYTDLLVEAGHYIGQTLRIMAMHKNDGILFHCSAGKDRTGVIAALLLSLAGVNSDLIIEDYAKTYPIMKEVFAQEIKMAAARGRIENESTYYSEPSYMSYFLEYMRQRYYSAERYLMHYLTKGELQILKEMLVDI